MKKLLILAVAMLLLSGCTAKNLPPVMLMPKTIETAQAPVTRSSLGDVSVTTSKENVDPYINDDNFRVALIETVKRSNLLGDSDNDKINIAANVYKATMPGWGGTKEGELGVHYKVTKSSGQLLFDEDVYYKGVSDAFESFFGSQRAILAFQRTNQGHMDLFMAKFRTALESIGK